MSSVAEKLDTARTMFAAHIAPAERTRVLEGNCEGIGTTLPLVLRPAREEDVVQIVRDLYALELPYYVVARGQNWGYGTARGVGDSEVLVDLSALDNVTAFDDALGLVELQPGVTTQRLADELTARGGRWAAPVTGAGPNGSVLANALERGFGLNPIVDHFDAIVSVRALLPNGELYTSTLAAVGAHRSDRVSKWKVGPYLEGLFGQSSLGIVLALTIQLAPRPRAVNLIVLKASAAELPKLIGTVQQLRRAFPTGVLGGVNVSNKARLLSTIEHDASATPDSLLFRIAEKLTKASFDDYQAIIPLLSYHPADEAMHRAVHRACKASGLRATFISEAYLTRLSRLKKYLYIASLARIWDRAEDALAFMQLMKGQPSPFTLKAAYADHPARNVTSNPAVDGIGLFWFAPILSLTHEDVAKVLATFERVLPKYRQRALLTFTNFDQRLVEATVPIYFDPAVEGDRERALTCWQELYDGCLADGFAPYRYSVLHMQHASAAGSVGATMKRALKEAVDPKLLFARGRYESI